MAQGPVVIRDSATMLNMIVGRLSVHRERHRFTNKKTRHD